MVTLLHTHTDLLTLLHTSLHTDLLDGDLAGSGPHYSSILPCHIKLPPLQQYTENMVRVYTHPHGIDLCMGTYT